MREEEDDKQSDLGHGYVWCRCGNSWMAEGSVLFWFQGFRSRGIPVGFGTRSPCESGGSFWSMVGRVYGEVLSSDDLPWVTSSTGHLGIRGPMGMLEFTDAGIVIELTDPPGCITREWSKCEAIFVEVPFLGKFRFFLGKIFDVLSPSPIGASWNLVVYISGESYSLGRPESAPFSLSRRNAIESILVTLSQRSMLRILGENASIEFIKEAMELGSWSKVVTDFRTKRFVRKLVSR